MSALGKVVRSGVGRRRVQSLVMAWTTFTAMVSSVLSLALLTGVHSLRLVRVDAGSGSGVPRILPKAAAASTFPLLLRRAATVLTVLGLAMIPWLVFLHTGPPATAQASHWAWTWTGLDSFEALGLLSTGLLLRRGDCRACLTSAATSAVLLVDAWFDTMTAAPGSDFKLAVLMAVFAELPLAVACGVLAIRTFPRPRL